MSLIGAHLSTDLVRIREQITQAKCELESDLADPDKFKELLDECERHKNELTQEITASKKKEF